MSKRRTDGHGVAQRYFYNANPTLNEVREGIAQQTCPWCGAGPFRCLAIHTTAIHGVDKYQLRDAALVVKSARVCAAEYSEYLSDRVGDDHPMLLASKRHPGKQNVSRAGFLVKQELALHMQPFSVAESRGRANPKKRAFARSRKRRDNGTFL